MLTSTSPPRSEPSTGPEPSVVDPAEGSDAVASFALFRKYFDAGDLPEAERVGALLPASPPDQHISVWTHLGLLRRRNKLAGRAIEAFLEARHAARAADRPLPDWFHSELSGAYVEQRAWPLALEAAEAGLGVKPVLGLTAATALVHLGRLAPARAHLRDAVQALAPESARAPLVASACTVLFAADQGVAAQAVVAEAAAAFPASESFAELRATLAFLREDWEEAAQRFARLFDAGAPAAALQRLQGVLRHAPAQGAAYAAIFEAAILANPDSEPMLFQWRNHLAATHLVEQVTARFIALQARAPAVLPALMLQLARQMPYQDLLQSLPT